MALGSYGDSLPTQLELAGGCISQYAGKIVDAEFGCRGELPGIDGEIVAVGQLIAAEARAHILMGHHLGPCMTLLACFAEDRACTAHMVRVTMRVAHMGHRFVRPAAQ